MSNKKFFSAVFSTGLLIGLVLIILPVFIRATDAAATGSLSFSLGAKATTFCGYTGTLSWTTTEVSNAKVTVTSGGQEKVFGIGASGTGETPWMTANTRVVFKLIDVDTNSVLDTLTEDVPASTGEYCGQEYDPFPTLPGIKSIKVTGTSKVGFQGRAGKIERMANGDGVSIFVEKNGGGAYPDTVSYKGKNWPVVLRLRIIRGDGQTFLNSLANISYGSFGFGVADVPGNRYVCTATLPSGQVVYAPVSNESACKQYRSKETMGTGVSFSWGLERPDLLPGAPIPGLVKGSVIANAWLFWRTEPCYSGVEMAPCGPNDYNNQKLIESSNYSPEISFFTIAPPPKINSANKTSVKHGETITLTGESFDDIGAMQGWLYGDAILFNYDPATGRSQKIVNVEPSDDFVHYCTPTKLKFEVPADLPSGNYKVRLRNEWGISNAIDIQVQAGTGTRESDPQCTSLVRQITSISPTSGPVGTVVTIKGKGFGSATSGASANIVKFGGAQAQVVNVNLERTQIKAQVPEGAVTGFVTVTTPGFPVIRGPAFAVTGEGGGEEGLSVENLFPEEVYLNEENEILIEGEGFNQNTILTSSDQAVSISDVQISSNGKYLTAVLSISGAPRSVPFKILTESQEFTLTKEVETKDPQAPEISEVAIAPTDIQGEVTMIIEGANLGTVTDVAFRGAPNLVVNNFGKAGNQIVVNISVSEFSPSVFELIHGALAAAEGDPALLEIKSSAGNDTKRISSADFLAKAGNPTLPSGAGIAEMDLPAFISSIYSFALTIVGLAVFVRILYAGFLWLTAAGNTTRTGQAKSMITNAVIGAIILFAAYLILNVINPDLVKNTFDFTIPSK